MTYKKSKETKDRILTTAKRLFYEQGFDNTSLRQICKDSNINHSLIYYYFENGKYGIGQFLNNQHTRNCLKAVSKYYPYQSNYLLFQLLFIRFKFREILQDTRDFECYIGTWQLIQPNHYIFIDTYSIAKELKLATNFDEVKKAVFMSDYIWNGLYESKKKGDLLISDKEIRDLTDLTRWMNLGLNKDFLLTEIAKAEALLNDIPIHHIHLINSH